MTFEPEELERYARHIVLREVGGPGQAKLKSATVLVVGVGGLGCPAAQYLTAAGIGCLRLVDDDTVSLSNLQRQILFRTEDVGRPKVLAAAQTLRALNPHVLIEPEQRRLDESSAALLKGVDLVLDGSDSFATRYAVNALCVQAGIPLISGAMTQWEGQLALLDPARGGPCYACIFPKAPEPGLVPNCAEAGVVGALAGTMGTMMASAAVRRLTAAGEDDLGKLLIYDSLYPDLRRLVVKRHEGCAVCG
jgi:molybdopterin/thiamine biosynthesis adenylyltransferase